MTDITGEFWITVQGLRRYRQQPVHAVVARNITQKRPTRLGVDETTFKVNIVMDSEIFDPSTTVVTMTIPKVATTPIIAEADQDATKIR